MFNQFNVNLYGKKMNNIHKELIKTKHYLKTWRSLKEQYVFEMIDELNGEIVGLAIFGQPCGASVIKKYGEGTLELRRFYVLDGLPKNSSSWFLSRCLRTFKHTNVKKVVSYSDPNVGHKGIIYQAANFQYLGKEIGTNPRVCIYKKKKIHMRMFYQKSKLTGQYRPQALFYQNLVKEGKARIKNLKRKDIYLYEIKK